MSARFARFLAMVAAGAMLAGCTQGSGRLSPRQAERIDRVLASAPGAAQPSNVVATEIAFARTARDEGTGAAFDSFAASDAVVHGAGGPISAEEWLAGLGEADRASQWGARTVWMSCDASLAISEGRFRNSDLTVGTYVTVWRRQGDGRYRYVYHGRALDDPQPVRLPQAEPGPDEIVVTGIGTIRGEVADCAAPGTPAPTAIDGAGVVGSGGGTSGDGTLVWRWTQFADGRRLFASSIYRDGAWERATNFAFGSTTARGG